MGIYKRLFTEKTFTENLFEAKDFKRIIIEKLKIPEEIATLLVDRFSSASAAVANSYANEKKKEFDSLRLRKDKRGLELFWNKFLNENRRSFEQLRHWLINFNFANSKIKGKTFSELVVESEIWHEEKENKEILTLVNHDEVRPVVIDYRNKNGEGFYWLDLEESTCKEEGDMMGHCGSGYNLYSLRRDKFINGDKITSSHITLNISFENIVTEIKGKKNNRPSKIYFDYIYDFLMLDIVEGIDGSESYNPSNNFFLFYLSQNQITNILDGRTFFVGPVELGVVEIGFTIEEILETFFEDSSVPYFFKNIEDIEINYMFGLDSDFIQNGILGHMIHHDYKSIYRRYKSDDLGDSELEEIILNLEASLEGEIARSFIEYVIDKVYDEISDLGFDIDLESLSMFAYRNQIFSKSEIYEIDRKEFSLEFTIDKNDPESIETLIDAYINKETLEEISKSRLEIEDLYTSFDYPNEHFREITGEIEKEIENRL